MTVKTKITIATIYTIYDDERASETNTYLFIGIPSKVDIKSKYLEAIPNVKKATVCEVERMNIDVDINSENFDKPFSESLQTALTTKDIHVASTIV